jgi:hypothetical protein
MTVVSIYNQYEDLLHMVKKECDSEKQAIIEVVLEFGINDMPDLDIDDYKARLNSFNTVDELKADVLLGGLVVATLTI